MHLIICMENNTYENSVYEGITMFRSCVKDSGVTKMKEMEFLSLSHLPLRILQIVITKYMIETMEGSEKMPMTREKWKLQCSRDKCNNFK